MMLALNLVIECGGCNPLLSVEEPRSNRGVRFDYNFESK